jgi:hypothetical protein
MISRQWRGVAKAQEAANYIRDLEGETFPQLARLARFTSATILRKPVAHPVRDPVWGPSPQAWA